METNVSPGEWAFVRFNQDPDAVIRSGFQSDAFTICSGLIYYNPQATTCAVVYGQPKNAVFKNFWQWLDGAVEPPGTKMIVIYPQVSGSDPGIYFNKSVQLMTDEANCQMIVGRHSAPATRENRAVKVTCNRYGYAVLNNRNEAVVHGNW